MRVVLLSVAFIASFPLLAAAQTNPRVAEIGNLAQGHAVAQRCQWFAAAHLEKLKTNRDEALAEVQTLLPAQSAAAKQAVTAGESAATAEACTGPAGDKRRQDVTGLLNQVEVMMTLRMGTLVAAENMQPYANQITTLRPYKALIDQRLASVQGSADPAQLRAVVESNLELSRNLIAITCAERKTVRWTNGERPCPAINSTNAAQAPYARLLIANAEAYALTVFGPPPARGTGQLVAGLQDNVLRPGEKFCRIQKTIGAASLNADTSPQGLVTFTITINLPATAVKGTGLAAAAATAPSKLTLSGDASMSESGRLVLRSVGGNFPGVKSNPPNMFASTIVLGDLRIALQATAGGAGTSLSNAILSPDMALEGFGILAAKPQVNLMSSVGITAVATLPDLAALLKAMDRASLLTAYQQCWP